VFGRTKTRENVEVLAVLGGILPAWLERVGWVEVELPQVCPPVPWADTEWLAEWLWPHQQAAVDAALTAPLGRSILEVPTGGGKTRIAAGLGVAGALAGARRWLYAAPNLELLKQAKSTFDAAPGTGSVQWEFSTYSQLRAEAASLGEFDGAIFDEVHRAAACGWSFGVVMVKANIRVGMSGTPLDRTDARNPIVMGLTGPVVMRVELPELQEQGKLAKGSVVPVILVHDAGGRVRRIGGAYTNEEEPQRRDDSDDKLN
jgi:superfamily II DNA or RNA helicase